MEIFGIKCACGKGEFKYINEKPTCESCGHVLTKEDTEIILQKAYELYSHNNKAKVYKMNDFEWWASNLSKEETLQFYLKYTGVSEDETYPVEDITECDLDTEGQYIQFEDKEKIKEFESTGLTELKIQENNGFGSILKTSGEYYIKVPFREAIKGFKETDEPYCTASTEW